MTPAPAPTYIAEMEPEGEAGPNGAIASDADASRERAPEGADPVAKLSLGAWVSGLFPSAGELAGASLLGALVIALTNAVAIAVLVPWPSGGWRMRLLHHGFDFAQTLMGGVALASLGVAASLLKQRFPRVPRSVGWVCMVVATTASMRWLLDDVLRRRAVVVMDGQLEQFLYPTFVLLCGLAIPFAFVVGHAMGKARSGRVLVAVGALVGIAAGHWLWRDDFLGVHTATLWALGCLVGAVAGRQLHARMARARPALAAIPAAIALFAVAVAPPNDIRIEQFKEAGAVVAWVLARSLWTLPELPRVASSADAGFLGPYPTHPARRKYPREPVVVMITVEAMRADVLSNRDHDRELPTLARLRDTGAYFPRAITPGSKTSVSLTTVFSGRYFSQLLWKPHGTGRARFLYAHEDPAPRFPALLTEAGVQTHSYLGLNFLAGDFGIAAGFEKEHPVFGGREHASAADVVGPLLDRLRATGAGKFFHYAHVLEPHEPYDRGERKTGTDYERYVSEVAVVDRWIDQLYRVIRARFPTRGYLVITGDHGEAFGEHGTTFHSKTLYDELVRVPLIIWGPGIQGREVSEPVGLIDLGPTFLQLYGCSVPPHFMGQSLLPLIEGQVDQLERPLFTEGRLRRAYFTRNGLKVIVDARRKLVEAYDLSHDPTESRNLFDDEPARFEPELAVLQSFFEHHVRRDPPGYEPPFKR